MRMKRFFEIGPLDGPLQGAGGMKRRLLSCCAVGALMVAGCNAGAPCDSIKVGDTIEEDRVMCFSSPHYGYTLTGTCSETGVWTCAATRWGTNAYASACAAERAAFHCMVELDPAGKVVCVKQFCQD